MIRFWIPKPFGSIAFFASCVWLFQTTSGFAEEPARDAMWGASKLHYEVLSRPATKHNEAKPRTSAPQVVRPVKPYAYGWFGATPSKHWYRQFGHQDSYTQYSLR
ncbi:hypothetical protein SH501x_000324 [Pirellulaceae bacterium SH501]